MSFEPRRQRAAGPTLRVALRDPGCLLEGLTLAQESAWVDGCTADLDRGFLEVRAPGAGDRALACLRDQLARLGQTLR